jgi:hypothetical protein
MLEDSRGRSLTAEERNLAIEQALALGELTEEDLAEEEKEAE